MFFLKLVFWKLKKKNHCFVLFSIKRWSLLNYGLFATNNICTSMYHRANFKTCLLCREHSNDKYIFNKNKFLLFINVWLSKYLNEQKGLKSLCTFIWRHDKLPTAFYGSARTTSLTHTSPLWTSNHSIQRGTSCNTTTFPAGNILAYLIPGLHPRLEDSKNE